MTDNPTAAEMPEEIYTAKVYIGRDYLKAFFKGQPGDIKYVLDTAPREKGDYEATLHKIVMKHCADKLSMEECRNLEIEILSNGYRIVKDGDNG